MIFYFYFHAATISSVFGYLGLLMISANAYYTQYLCLLGYGFASRPDGYGYLDNSGALDFAQRGAGYPFPFRNH